MLCRILATITLLLLSTCVNAQTAKVTHVSDGDSFIIANGERVRMIGVDAPELADNFGRESKEHLATLIRDKTVALERDPLNDDRDVHGRLLRFVSVNGTDINKQMIADGYAKVLLRYPFARQRQNAYREAETAAKRDRRGIWRVATDSPLESVPSPAAPNDSARVPEAAPAPPELCAGTIVLLFITILGLTRSKGRV